MSQTPTKFIQDNAATGAKIRLNNNESLRARNFANSADLEILKVTSANVPEFQMLPSVNGALAIPSTDKQLATVEYIRNYLEGKSDVKNAAAYLAGSNIAGTFNAGSSTIPATLTGVVALAVDGRTFVAGDVSAITPMRIALIGQAAGLQNGAYDLTAAGASSFTLTRSSDFDGINNVGGQEVTNGAWFRVTSGTVYAGYEVQLTTADPIVINTTALVFAAYPSALTLTGGDMIVKVGNDFAVDLAALGGLESSNPGNSAGQLRVKTATGALEKDRTVTLDGSGNLVSKKRWKTPFVLTGADIANQYVDLPRVAGDNSVDLVYPGAGAQVETVDFTVNYTGGSGSKTRITFAGGLASAGASALAAGETIYVDYEAFGP